LHKFLATQGNADILFKAMQIFAWTFALTCKSVNQIVSLYHCIIDPRVRAGARTWGLLLQSVFGLIFSFLPFPISFPTPRAYLSPNTPRAYNPNFSFPLQTTIQK
jgi:hypothetical protein